MIVKPFRSDHLRRLLLEPAHQYLRPGFTDAAQIELLETLGQSFAGLNEDGRVVACGGVVPVWPGRAMVWSVLAQHSGPCMVTIHKVTQRLLASRTERRIEATCEADFQAAHRWLRLLGFRMEAERMEAFGADGKAHSLYAKVR